ncbi:MAG: zinc dependent phospholipase C family protein [Gemmatimonadaceae bacterium]|nr:zinc dependent phospholipase C family protein [Gemmatimonadaceae bacterium]MCW5825053.1 zinc dependent phospholipase C family protein [Gemmatimonadaceae bacterium]
MNRRAVGIALGAVALLALFPTDALAWTPGTHVMLGEALLRSADLLLPTALAQLLKTHPFEFLYGSIAADTSFAKRYARIGRHCHYWHVGDEILDRARDDALRAFGYGYLAHLAADVVAHNHFVPHQLAISSTTSGAGHAYWEARFESALGEQWSRRAREVILLDHWQADDHLDRILSPTIFSTSTNRRIFRGMVHASDLSPYQRMLSLMATNSRWPLRAPSVTAHLDRAFDHIVDLLVRGADADARRADPSGEEALHEAKRIRRGALERGGERAARKDAADRFALPPAELQWVRRLPKPLYEPLADVAS